MPLGCRVEAKTRTSKKMSRSRTIEYAPSVSAITIFESERGRKASGFNWDAVYAPTENMISDRDLVRAASLGPSVSALAD